jgi:radical SAM protein with 4Fe4S-binding SPASM domain
MTIIFVPTLSCNFQCTGCFESKELHNAPHLEYDFEGMRDALEEIWKGPYGGSSLCLHGGESTLIPKREIEKCLQYLHSKQGAVSIVTNGSQIDDYLIALFKRYNVYVTLSIDGPSELNIHRGPDPTNVVATREYNEKTKRVMGKLCDAKVPTSIICILHKDNAGSPEALDKLGAWILELKRMGISGGRLNLMYCSPDSKHLELSPLEALDAWKFLYKLNKNEQLNWNPFREMTKNLLGFKCEPCNFNQCDPFNTQTLSILPDGSVGNCDRTFARGIYLRSKSGNKSGRYQALQQTQCMNCKYWQICGGACPEEGEDNDWRNKTRFCEAIYGLYQHIENDIRGIFPWISLVMDRDFTGNPFAKTETPKDAQQIQVEHGDIGHNDLGHGDDVHGNNNHGDDAHGDIGHGDVGHGDIGHGDIAHGDSHHGDSQDWD